MRENTDQNISEYGHFYTVFISQLAWTYWKFNLISNKGTMFRKETIKKSSLFLNV